MIADTNYKKEQRFKETLTFLFSTLWLPQGQLWQIIEGTVSLIQC